MPLFSNNHFNLGIFRPFFVQKWHKIANFQNFQKNLLNFGALYGVVIWCKFQLIWTKIEGADTFGVKYLIMLILSIFSQEILPKSRTSKCDNFWMKINCTFPKKLLIPLEDTFQIRSTWIFLPWSPPYRLKS